MEIRFCSVCNESIPDGEFDAGRAVSSAGKSQHVACALKRAVDMNGRRSWLTSLLALYAAGVATFLLVAQLGSGKEAPPPEIKQVPDVVETRIAAANAAGEARLVALLDERLGRSETRLTKHFREDLTRNFEERTQVDLGALDKRTETALKAIHDRLGTLDGRGERSEVELSRLAGWFDRIQRQADALEEVLSQSSRPAPTAPADQDPAPPPAEDADAPGDVADPIDDKVAEWIANLSNKDDDLVFSATLELGQLGDLRAQGPLMEVLDKHDNLYARLGAAAALGSLKSCNAVTLLIDSLMDKEPLVQTQAADSVDKVSGERFQFSNGMSKNERRRVQRAMRAWWKANEAEVRERLKQPVAAED